jgi:hypothetical protein
VTQHAPTLQQRFAASMASLQRDVRKLQTRTAGIDSGFPLAALPAQVDPAYTGTGDPNVLINGSAALSGPCQHLASYTPAAGDQVLVIPVGVSKTYVILGKLT